jgi:hypothetical protein
MNSSLLNLIVVQTRDIGPGFQIANRAASLDCEILELSILGKGALLILSTGDQDPESIRSKIGDREALVSAHRELPSEIFDAYLSVHQAAVIESNLVIVEAGFLGHLFEVSQLFPLANIVELRMIRGSQPKAYLLLSGLSEELIAKIHDQHLLTADLSRQVTLTPIGAVSESLTEYFQVKP